MSAPPSTSASATPPTASASSAEGPPLAPFSPDQLAWLLPRLPVSGSSRTGGTDPAGSTSRAPPAVSTGADSLGGL